VNFNFADLYEAHLVAPLFQPFAAATLDALAPAPGEHLLDLACGTGIVARLAHERDRSGRIVGVDISPDMIAVARRSAPAIEWRVGDAMQLSLEDGEAFDIVVCQQGLQFVPDRSAAARELVRALGPRGRVAVSTWRPLEESPFFREVHPIAERHLGQVVDRRHGFADATALEALLREAGLRDTRVTTLTRTIRFEDGAAIIRMNAMALVGMSEAGKGMSDEERGRVAGAIAAESAAAAAAWVDGASISFELGTNLAIGRR